VRKHLKLKSEEAFHRFKNHCQLSKRRVGLRQRVLMLLLAESVILVVCQKVRLGFLNVRSLRRLAAFNITAEHQQPLPYIDPFCILH
jgi:hypothetical protein